MFSLTLCLLLAIASKKLESNILIPDLVKVKDDNYDGASMCSNTIILPLQ